LQLYITSRLFFRKKKRKEKKRKKKEEKKREKKKKSTSSFPFRPFGTLPFFSFFFFSPFGKLLRRMKRTESVILRD